jgi:hypothetical protein
METFGITGVAAITLICYLIGIAAKNIKGLDNKWIPTICGVLGGVLGVPAMLIMPDFPATDYITAIAIGIASGLAATGVNQVVKQLTKEDDKNA